MKDPNINKIVQDNMVDIKQGNYKTVISQVRDYLFYITNTQQASKELTSFIQEVKKLH